MSKATDEIKALGSELWAQINADQFDGRFYELVHEISGRVQRDAYMLSADMNESVELVSLLSMIEGQLQHAWKDEAARREISEAATCLMRQVQSGIRELKVEIEAAE